MKISLMVGLWLTVIGNAYHAFAELGDVPPGTPDDPTGTISTSGESCGDQTLTRSDNPPAGDVWYWQTSSTGTSVTNDGSTYDVSSSGTYYIRAYKPSSQEWSVYSISFTATINQIPATPTTPTVVNTCTGSTLTRTSPPGGVTWYWQTSASGTSTSNSSTDYNTTGTGTRYLRARSSAGCWSASSASVSYDQLDAPADPSYTLTSNTCGDKTLSANNPPHSSTGIFWKWHNTTNNGTGMTAFTNQTISSTDTYYIRAYDENNGCWSSSVAISVTINDEPATPSTTINETNNCGETVLVRNSSPSGNIKWYWQTTSGGTSTGNDTDNYTATSGTTVFLRAKNTVTGCWSVNSKTVSYTVRTIPSIPWVPDTNSSSCGGATVGYDLITAQNKDWYWQTSATGTAKSNSELVELNLSHNFSSDGTTYVRAYDSGSDCWSDARVINYTINPIPEVATGDDTNRCEAGNVTLTASPGTNGNEILWYDAASGGTLVHTGSSYTVNLSITTTYYAASYNTTTLCENTTRTAIQGIINSNPVNTYTVTGGGPHCAGTDVAIGLSDSEVGFNYQLVRNGSINVGSPVAGTGSAISFVNQNSTGTYTVVATHPTTTCTDTMTGDLEILTAVPPPNTPTVSTEECTERHFLKPGTEPHSSVYGFPITWFWFDNDENNASPTVLQDTTKMTQPDTYYIKSRGDMSGGQTCWSVSVAIDVNDLIPGPEPKLPKADSISLSNEACDAKTATISQTLPGGTPPQKWFWQGTDAISRDTTTVGNTSADLTTNQNYYIRSRTDEGCWSEAVPFAVSGVNMYPVQQTLKGTGEFANNPSTYRKVYLDDTEADVIYKVYTGGQQVGSFNGTGDFADSDILTSDGDYTVVADRNGCTTNASGTISIGGDENMNYGISRSFTVPVTNPASLPTTNGDVLKSRSYADAFGRPLQSIVHNITPDEKDMVSFYEYDDLGRMAKQYLPYVDTTSDTLKANTKTNQAAFYLASGDNIANDSLPYGQTNYEASPMNRVKSQFGVGKAWFDQDRKGSITYSTNSVADSVLIWQVINDTLFVTGIYSAGDLYETTSMDEENHEVISYTNKLGQVVLKRVEDGPNSWAETYNAYDKKGRLCYVIPPLAMREYDSPDFGEPSAPYGHYLVRNDTTYAEVETISEGKIAFTPDAKITINSEEVLNKGTVIQSYDSISLRGLPVAYYLDEQLFQYVYDKRNRLIAKKVPGSSWTYLVYDDRNRLVLSQDGNQRNYAKWSFVKYDALNRKIMTGEKLINGSVAEIRTAVAADTVFFESYDSLGLMNYTNNAYPTSIVEDDIYTVTYYDDYDFTSKSFNLPAGIFTDTTDYRETPAKTTHALKGLVTGGKMRVLGDTLFLETVNFYDDEYRVVQSISDLHTGGEEIATVQYNFAGEVMKTHVKHNPRGAVGDTTIIEQTYTYDHAGRPLTTKHSINGATAVTIASYSYNELGELENKSLADGYEDIDFSYNIRGWITKLNDPNDSEDHLFEMEFKYETATYAIYNGNIGEVGWKNPYESTTSSFDYTYDEMDRLKTADYSDTGNSGRDYGLESISYDANGNILSLKRKGDHDDSANQSFDDLHYAYDANRLMSVADSSNMSTGFEDGVALINEYAYDDNGNLTEDKNKNITSIGYNHINQPIYIVKSDSVRTDSLVFTYSAAGVKLRQQEYREDTLFMTTDYVGGFLYQDDSLQLISHSQGRIVAERDVNGDFVEYEYQYHLTDHLGNVRVTFKTEMDTTVYLATVETENASVETPYFYNLDSTRYTHTLANQTSGGNEVSRVGQDSTHLIGPAIALRVVPGDTIDMEVYAYYEGGSGYNNTVTLATFINALASAFGGSSSAGGEAGAIYDGIDEALTAGAGGIGGSGNDNVPAAYLSYILFDQNYEEIQNGYHEISSSADLVKEKLFLDDIAITEAGYLYIYTSMQSNANLPVFFDDLKVTHRHSPVIQKDDYLPFGLSFNSYSRAAITAQNFKFNAGSEVEEMTDWYSTPFRKYDPSLGRFHGVDLLASTTPGITPSQYGLNNPINFNDPTGLTAAPTAIDMRGYDDPSSQGGGGGDGRNTAKRPDNNPGPDLREAAWAHSSLSNLYAYAGKYHSRSPKRKQSRKAKKMRPKRNPGSNKHSVSAAEGFAKLHEDFYTNSGIAYASLGILPDVSPSIIPAGLGTWGVNIAYAEWLKNLENAGMIHIEGDGSFSISEADRLRESATFYERVTDFEENIEDGYEELMTFNDVVKEHKSTDILDRIFNNTAIERYIYYFIKLLGDPDFIINTIDEDGLRKRRENDINTLEHLDPHQRNLKDLMGPEYHSPGGHPKQLKAKPLRWHKLKPDGE